MTPDPPLDLTYIDIGNVTSVMSVTPCCARVPTQSLRSDASRSLTVPDPTTQSMKCALSYSCSCAVEVSASLKYFAAGRREGRPAFHTALPAYSAVDSHHQPKKVIPPSDHRYSFCTEWNSSWATASFSWCDPRLYSPRWITPIALTRAFSLVSVVSTTTGIGSEGILKPASRYFRSA